MSCIIWVILSLTAGVRSHYIFCYFDLLCHQICQNISPGSVEKDEGAQTTVIHHCEACVHSTMGAMLVLELDDESPVQELFDSFTLYCKLGQGSSDEIHFS